MGVEVTVNVKGLDTLIALLPSAVERVVEQTARDVLTEAQAHAPVRTGNLKKSGVVEPGDDRFSRYVHFLADYAAFVELGTVRMAAQPYLLPAVERARQSFADALLAIL